jgi:hypothetical protein
VLSFQQCCHICKKKGVIFSAVLPHMPKKSFIFSAVLPHTQKKVLSFMSTHFKYNKLLDAQDKYLAKTHKRIKFE